MNRVFLERLKTAIGVTVPVLFCACGDFDPDGSPEEVDAVQSAIMIGPFEHAFSYIACAKELETCVVAADRYLAYGANGKFLFRTAGNPASSTIPCTSAFFGGDPAPGVVKKCYIANYVRGVAEGFGGWTTGNLAYGANGAFNFRTFHAEAYGCDNATFGDPLPGVAKACYYALPDYFMRASEGGTLTHLANTPVAYGANGKFFYKVASGTLTCGDEAFEGDPAFGFVKNCYELAMPYVNAEEGSRVNGEGTLAYWYGSGLNGNFIAKTLPTNTLCANSTFGGDPHLGFPKHCY